MASPMPINLGGLGSLARQRERKERARLLQAILGRQQAFPVEGPSSGAPVFAPGGGANVHFTGGSPFPVDPRPDRVFNALLLATRLREAARAARGSSSQRPVRDRSRELEVLERARVLDALGGPGSASSLPPRGR